MVTIDNASALQTLDAASDTEAPVSLMVAHMAMSCTGKLRGAIESGVVIELSSAPPEPINVGDRCAVTFPLAGRSAGFTSRVLSSVDGKGGRVLVTVEPPEKIQPSEQRMSVRVPVPLGALAVAVMNGESPRSVKPIDLSLDGILIEYPDGEDPDIEIGHRRVLVLERGKHKVLAEAEVRRQAGQRFGLLFMFHEGRPKDMIRIVAELQHLWNEV